MKFSNMRSLLLPSSRGQSFDASQGYQHVHTTIQVHQATVWLS